MQFSNNIIIVCSWLTKFVSYAEHQNKKKIVFHVPSPRTAYFGRYKSYLRQLHTSYSWCGNISVTAPSLKSAAPTCVGPWVCPSHNECSMLHHRQVTLTSARHLFVIERGVSLIKAFFLVCAIKRWKTLSMQTHSNIIHSCMHFNLFLTIFLPLLPAFLPTPFPPPSLNSLSPSLPTPPTPPSPPSLAWKMDWCW